MRAKYNVRNLNEVFRWQHPFLHRHALPHAAGSSLLMLSHILSTLRMEPDSERPPGTDTA